MAGFLSRLGRVMSDRAPAALAEQPTRQAPAFTVGARTPTPMAAGAFAKKRDSVPDLATVVAAHRVPRDTLLSVQRAQPFRFYAGAVHTHEFVASGATSVVVALPNGMARSTRAAPALPTQAHPDVRAYVSNDGLAFTAANVTAVDFATGDVTVTKTASTTAVRVHYLPVRGEIELRVIRPNGGSVDAATRQWNAALASLATTDQDRGETALRLTGLQPTFSLPPEWELGFVVRSPDVIAWDSPLTELALDAYTQRVSVLDQAGLYAMAERSLRG